MDDVALSKFLSFVLRHRPEAIGLALDKEGWAEVDRLLECAAASGKPFNRARLEAVVANNDKQRFRFSPDGLRIRAVQGHSADGVAIERAAVEPPNTLFHGTATHFLDAILTEGLRPGARHQVHLSGDRETAVAVGRRHGKPVVLAIAAAEMRARGHRFYHAENGVWLVDAVPPEFLAVVAA